MPQVKAIFLCTDTASSARHCADSKNSKTCAPVYNALGTPYSGKVNENPSNEYLKYFGAAIVPTITIKNATTKSVAKESKEVNIIFQRTRRLKAKKKNRKRKRSVLRKV